MTGILLKQQCLFDIMFANPFMKKTYIKTYIIKNNVISFITTSMDTAPSEQKVKY